MILQTKCIRNLTRYAIFRVIFKSPFICSYSYVLTSLFLFFFCWVSSQITKYKHNAFEQHKVFNMQCKSRKIIKLEDNAEKEWGKAYVRRYLKTAENGLQKLRTRDRKWDDTILYCPKPFHYCCRSFHYTTVLIPLWKYLLNISVSLRLWNDRSEGTFLMSSGRPFHPGRTKMEEAWVQAAIVFTYLRCCTFRRLCSDDYQTFPRRLSTNSDI